MEAVRLFSVDAFFFEREGGLSSLVREAITRSQDAIERMEETGKAGMLLDEAEEIVKLLAGIACLLPQGLSGAEATYRIDYFWPRLRRDPLV